MTSERRFAVNASGCTPDILGCAMYTTIFTFTIYMYIEIEIMRSNIFAACVRPELQTRQVIISPPHTYAPMDIRIDNENQQNDRKKQENEGSPDAQIS